MGDQGVKHTAVTQLLSCTPRGSAEINRSRQAKQIWSLELLCLRWLDKERVGESSARGESARTSGDPAERALAWPPGGLEQWPGEVVS